MITRTIKKGMEISHYLTNNLGDYTISLELDLDELGAVDPYSYHDYPSSVSIYLSEKDMRAMIHALNDLLGVL